MKVGIQLYSVRNALAQDPVGTLKKVGELGYKYIEPANHDSTKDPGIGFPIAAAEVKAILDEYGMEIIASHVEPLAVGKMGDIIRYYQTLGTGRIGWEMDFFEDLEDAKRRGETLNAVGKELLENGIRLYYHNHFQEFQIFEGKTALEHLADHTDPAYMDFELDTFWCARGGQDPVAMMDTLGKRLVLLHQKDFSGDAGQPLNLFDGVVDPNGRITMETFIEQINQSAFIEIGTGRLPIQTYIDKGNALGVPYILLEQDYTKLDEIESIRLSMEHFRRFSGIEWS